METERLRLRSTRGVPREWEFILSPAEDGCRVKSILRVAGCTPKCGPAVLTPVPYALARRWIECKAAKLRRHAARFAPLTLRDEILEAIGTARTLEDPAAVFEEILQQGDWVAVQSAPDARSHPACAIRPLPPR